MDVQAEGSDPLEGWDEGHGRVIDLRVARTARGLPDAALLVLSALVGTVLGALSGRGVRGVAAGGLVGLVAGAVRRRIWELNP